MLATIIAAAAIAPGAGGGGMPAPLAAVLHDASYSETDVGAVAAFTLSVDGLATGELVADSGPASYAWRVEGAATDFEVRATPISGNFSTGTVNAWLSLGSDRGWSCVRSTRGSRVASALFEIRQVGGDGTILASATISLSATST